MDNKEQKVDETITYKVIAEALFENYESIYDINMDTHKYKTYHQSNNYQHYMLSQKGNDFFKDNIQAVERIIAPCDRERVLEGLSYKALEEAFKKDKHYTLIYQIDINGENVFHQLKATRKIASDGVHILMGIKNIDEIIKQQITYQKQIEAMEQKKHNHMEAVLASAAAYVEADLSDNRILERSISFRANKNIQIMEVPKGMRFETYDRLQEWITEHIVIKKKERFLQVSSRKYLLETFKRGETRTSVLFTARSENNNQMLCRAIFYLYEEKTTGKICVFYVVYDLTEQQQKERERDNLEKELQYSRIRNSTSQMQPHFLYNALGSIQEVILIDPQYASDLLGDFTVHLRSCVRAMSNDEPVSFEEELKNITAYVNIEKMRYGDKLSVEYDIKTAEFNVLPLCIQPLVENAIRHGIHHRGKKGGKVVLRTWKERGEWVVQVEDNGVGFNVQKVIHEVQEGKKDSTGLLNIRFRLEKILGARIELKSIVGEGTTVTVRIPGTEAADASNNS